MALYFYQFGFGLFKLQVLTVAAKIKLRLLVEWRKKTVSIKRFSIEDLKKQEINRQYKNKLKETLHLTESSNNVDNLWNEIENSIKTAATEVLRFEERKTGKKWFDEQCKKASNERDIARIKMLKDPTTIIKDEGLLITDKTKAANEFKNMFETMLNQPTQVDVEENLSTVEQRLDEPTIEEVERAVDMLKNGKAPEEDAIVAELLIGGKKELMTQLKRLVNNISKQEEIPTTWHMSVLCPVHKKGDAIVCQNYKGISLLNTCYKVVSNNILNRIKHKGNNRGISVGFYAREIYSGSNSYNKTNSREKLWKAMTQLGILTKLVRLIKACVQKSKCKVKFNGELSEDFSVEIDLRQRDALSPTLFNIALESVVREVLDDATGLRIREGHQITLAAYADDIIIIGETEEDLKRITAGNKSYFELVPVFKLRLISKNTKIRLYKVLIKPIVLYACGAWASTKSDEKRLLLFERKILRRIYGPKRNEENLYERRTNAELRAIFNEPNIVGILKSRRISWAGHVWRVEGQTVHDVTMWKPNKKRPIGRPRQRWTDQVKEDLKLLGIREGELAKN
ncbi:hypothetical protein QTP88_027621 [Uroleucon formosanum]